MADLLIVSLAPLREKHLPALAPQAQHHALLQAGPVFCISNSMSAASPPYKKMLCTHGAGTAAPPLLQPSAHSACASPDVHQHTSLSSVSQPQLLSVLPPALWPSQPHTIHSASGHPSQGLQCQSFQYTVPSINSKVPPTSRSGGCGTTESRAKTACVTRAHSGSLTEGTDCLETARWLWRKWQLRPTGGAGGAERGSVGEYYLRCVTSVYVV